MAELPDLGNLDAQELTDLIERTAFELNLYVRAGSLAGIVTHAVLVAVNDPEVHPSGYPQVHVKVTRDDG